MENPGCGRQESLRDSGRRFFAKHRWKAVTSLLEAEALEGEMLRAIDIIRNGPIKAYRVLTDLAAEQLVLRVENTESLQSRRRANARALLVTLSIVAVSIALILAAAVVSSASLQGATVILLIAALATCYLAMLWVGRKLS